MGFHSNFNGFSKFLSQLHCPSKSLVYASTDSMYLKTNKIVQWNQYQYISLPLEDVDKDASKMDKILANWWNTISVSEVFMLVSFSVEVIGTNKSFNQSNTWKQFFVDHFYSLIFPLFSIKNCCTWCLCNARKKIVTINCQVWY